MKRLLLVIDLQQGWVHPATQSAMRATVDLAKRFDGDIIHCCFKNDPTSLFVIQLNWSRFIAAPDTDVIPDLAALDVPVYWRSGYSCLTDEVVTRIGRYDQVYIAGVFTDISVAATAMGVFDLGIKVSVVGDCVGTLHGESVHRAALSSLEHAIGGDHVITATAVPQR